MPPAARRRQPPITIRSTRAAELLRRLAVGGRSQAAVIEEALERMASQRKSAAQALAPAEAHDFEWHDFEWHDFEWEPALSTIAARSAPFDD